MAVIDKTIEVEIAGVKRQLAKPTRRNRDRLFESTHAWKKERLADNLRLAGIDGSDMLPHLSKFDNRHMTMDDLLDYVNSIGVTELLERSLASYGDEASVIVDAVDNPIELACKLWGWTTGAEIKSDDSPLPNEQTPPAQA